MTLHDYRDTSATEGSAEIRLRARRRIGELSAALETAPGVGGHNREACPTAGTSLKRDALKSAGLTKTEAHRCEQLARVPEEKFEAYIAQKAGKAPSGNLPEGQGDRRDVVARAVGLSGSTYERARQVVEAA